MKVSKMLLLQNVAMLKTWSVLAKESVIKSKRKHSDFASRFTRKIKAPSTIVVDAYHKWLGVTGKYNKHVAPHLFPYWVLPIAFEAGRSLSYESHKVLNQGCHLKIKGPIRPGQVLQVDCEVVSAKEKTHKILIHEKIVTKNAKGRELLVVDLMAVILKQKGRIQRKVFELPSNAFLLGKIKILDDDTTNFGLITGDINPIHMNHRLARLFGFRGKILHGFATMAKLYEFLESHGYEISEIDVKFLSPIYPTCVLNVSIMRHEQHFRVWITDERNKRPHLAGMFRKKEKE